MNPAPKTPAPKNAITRILQEMDYGLSPEDSGPARAWLARHEAGFGHFINGGFTEPAALFAVAEPATGKVIARASQAGAAEIDQAVRAARAAQPRWARLSGHQRARHLYALARHLQQHARFLAVLESIGNGKPLRESRDVDLPLVIRHFYHHAGQAELMAESFPGRAPWGVCAQVIPWNFPLMMLAWKVAPALAAGNTVVLKPAESTPLTALAFAEIAREAGLPKGVLNIVTGDGATGAALTTHDGVDKIAFTGSTAVGREIRRKTAGTGKGLSLELGGKSPFLVFADADLDAAVEGVVDAVWFNQGQVCSAAARILVAEAVAERFEALLLQRMAKLRTGDPLDKNSDLGAMISPAQLSRLRDLVAQGRAAGAMIHEGAAPETPGPGFCPPILASGVEPASPLFTEELFGPVATLTRFRTTEDALALANNSRYGLAASIWSENIGLATEVAAKVRAGVVWINAANLFDAAAPFGGIRDSGFGRDGGREGFAEYLRDADAGRIRPERAAAKPDPLPAAGALSDAVDRSAKLFIGGRQQRPDSGYSYQVTGTKGPVGLAPLGGRKDIRNAVEAARAASGWSGLSGHSRAQVLFYLAENLSARREDFTARLRSFGQSAALARAETDCAIARIFWYAAQADKFDGATHRTGAGQLTFSTPEPFGVMGLICPESFPLLGAVSLLLPALATGNRAVLVPSQSQALAATDLYQVIETSDLPAGVVNIVTGPRADLAASLAGHEDVDALWAFGDVAGMAAIEAASAGNLKPTWCRDGGRDWTGPAGQGRDFLTRATWIRTVWLPYGD